MSTFDISSMLGPNLVNQAKEAIPTSTLEGKYLMIYFSAHWRPPCRGFTPVLSKFYTGLKTQRSDFELIFVSSDRDEGSFGEYHKSMSFPALPYVSRDIKTKLAEKFKGSTGPFHSVVSTPFNSQVVRTQCLPFTSVLSSSRPPLNFSNLQGKRHPLPRRYLPYRGSHHHGWPLQGNERQTRRRISLEPQRPHPRSRPCPRPRPRPPSHCPT